MFLSPFSSFLSSYHCFISSPSSPITTHGTDTPQQPVNQSTKGFIRCCTAKHILLPEPTLCPLHFFSRLEFYFSFSFKKGCIVSSSPPYPQTLLKGNQQKKEAHSIPCLVLKASQVDKESPVAHLNFASIFSNLSLEYKALRCLTRSITRRMTGSKPSMD